MSKSKPEVLSFHLLFLIFVMSLPSFPLISRFIQNTFKTRFIQVQNQNSFSNIVVDDDVCIVKSLENIKTRMSQKFYRNHLFTFILNYDMFISAKLQ